MIAILFVVGSYLLVPPFGWVISLNDHFKDAGAEKYGEPPYGHAELSSLKTFAKKMNLDLARSMQLLEKAGYAADDSNMTLAAIGSRYNIPPQMVYETIKPAGIATAKQSTGKGMPESPPPGTGRFTLADLCTQYKLKMKLVIRELKQQGIEASEEMTLKEIAANNNTGPHDIYERIKSIVQN